MVWRGGFFNWKVGDGECEVLESFVQEAEFSHEFSQGGSRD